MVGCEKCLKEQLTETENENEDATASRRGTTAKRNASGGWRHWRTVQLSYSDKLRCGCPHPCFLERLDDLVFVVFHLGLECLQLCWDIYDFLLVWYTGELQFVDTQGLVIAMKIVLSINNRVGDNPWAVLIYMHHQRSSSCLFSLSLTESRFNFFFSSIGLLYECQDQGGYHCALISLMTRHSSGRHIPWALG